MMHKISRLSNHKRFFKHKLNEKVTHKLMPLIQSNAHKQMTKQYF